MKRILFVLCVGLVFATGCKKSSDTVELVTPTAPLTITRSDFNANYRTGGDPYSNGTINLTASPVSAPAPGENQNWDVSKLSLSAMTARGGYTTPNNSAYPSATFASATTHNFGFGALQSTGTAGTEFYEVGDNGFFYLGINTPTTDVITVPSIGGTLTYAPQNIVESPKYPELNLPAAYNSSTTTINIINNSNFIANAPAVGVINTPGQARITDSVNNTIMASGTLTLKTFGKVRVLVNKQTLSEKTNYFLGGAPAPAALLTLLGLTDGAITRAVAYDFYAEKMGRVGRITCNADGTTVVGAYFRVQ